MKVVNSADLMLAQVVIEHLFLLGIGILVKLCNFNFKEFKVKHLDRPALLSVWVGCLDATTLVWLSSKAR